MTNNGFLQIGLYLIVLLLLVKPLGWYMARVYLGQPIGTDRVLGPVERFLYRAGGIHPEVEMGWKTYAAAVLVFNGAGILLLYVMPRFQGVLPLNPQELNKVSANSSYSKPMALSSDWARLSSCIDPPFRA